MAKEPKKVEAPEGSKLYRLGRKFYNGKIVLDRGAEIYFVEGKQPKKAVLVEPDEVEIEAVEPKKSDK